MRRGTGVLAAANGGGWISAVADNGDAITRVPAATPLSAIIGAAVSRKSCCGEGVCALLCGWQDGTACSGACTRQRAKHWAFASASATESKMKTLPSAPRMRLQISMHSLQ